MTEADTRAAARQFAKDWAERGDERRDTQSFWLALLQKVLGAPEPEKAIAFEMPVKMESTTGFIDGYIHKTRVLIEQKGREVDLRRGVRQSDGSAITPFEQAWRYGRYLPHSMNPRWIVVCNFDEFRIHDMNAPRAEPEILPLRDLEREFARLRFLLDTGDEHIRREMEASIQAGALVGRLYDALHKQYRDPNSPRALQSLNMLCVRLVFCLYVEDAGIFGARAMFHDYIRSFPLRDVRRALIDLFIALDTPPDARDPYMDRALAAFPYVNGGLFAREDIEIPTFTQDIVDLLLRRASEDFDWSQISPTIFGAVFESTLNPQTRRAGGMHYTAIANIHKVIDPLFLDALRAELDAIRAVAVARTRAKKLTEFRKKLSHLTFLDPACGSGNFLTQTYISLRRLENEALREGLQGQVIWDIGDVIQVSIGQFYGIEINDFAVTVARTALWIAESQMMKETEDVVSRSLDFLPLRSYANIVEGNALRMDWDDVIPRQRLRYIMGNPPFVGARLMSAEQKSDLNSVFAGWKNTGNLDYVSCWYKKASDMMQGTGIRAALVSTNSVTQGEAVSILWKSLFAQGVHFDFAYRTFRWNSEATLLAHVHCVIIGFSAAPNPAPRMIYSGDRPQTASNINAYLVDAEDIFIESRSTPLSDVPSMAFGSMPNDNGHLSNYTDEERNAIVKAYPQTAPLFKRLMGAAEFINGKTRWCLWLEHVSPDIIRRTPPVAAAVARVRETRLNSKRKETRELADTPMLFGEIRQPDSDYIFIPRVSSENRKYVPMGFLDCQHIASDSALIIPNASLYHFGVLTSNVHMAWMSTVCGRLKSDYRYSKDIVYNNFPWPRPTPAQAERVTRAAQDILDARALYPDSSLADLYDQAAMPPVLRRAHQQNDRAVMAAYGFDVGATTQAACVAALMRLYREAAAEKGAPVA